MSKLRWGILGTGNIARQFAASFATARRGTLAAVGSRQADGARAFAQTYGVQSHFGSYEQVLASGEVDAVYVSLPNSLHAEWTIKALESGKHVLCEKPFAVSEAQAREVFEVAQRTGLLVAEAFMYRSHPLTDAVLEAVRSGKIGRVRMIRTSFCFRVWKTAGNIRFDPALAGGALMDIGCYCIHFSRLIAGAEPTSIVGISQIHPSGVDEVSAGLLQFPGNITASFTCGMSAQADNTACISGDEGYIEIPVPWKPPTEKAEWSLAFSIPPKMDQAGGIPALLRPKQTFTVDAGKALFALEADDFAAAVLDGRPSRITREDTLGNMRVLDELRRQAGVRF